MPNSVSVQRLSIRRVPEPGLFRRQPIPTMHQHGCFRLHVHGLYAALERKCSHIGQVGWTYKSVSCPAGNRLTGSRSGSSSLPNLSDRVRYIILNLLLDLAAYHLANTIARFTTPLKQC